MKTTEVLTDLQCTVLLDWLERQPATRNYLRNYCMLLLFLDCGLRVGELVHLKFDDLFYCTAPVQSLRIRKEIAKTGKERLIPLSMRLRECLKAIAKDTKWEELPSNGYFFPSPRDIRKPITIRNVQKSLQTWGARALGIDLHPHMVRHTFATRLLKVCDTRTVQMMLGHESLSSTQVYTHPSSADCKAAIDRMTGTTYI